MMYILMRTQAVSWYCYKRVKQKQKQQNTKKTKTEQK